MIEGENLTMMENNTVVIVGAGASQEFGLPTGERLAKLIISSLHAKKITNSRDTELYETLRVAAERENCDFVQLLNTAEQISSSLMHSKSIDNYIHSRKNEKLIALCGKIAITHQILSAELTSHICNHDGNKDELDFRKVDAKLRRSGLDDGKTQDLWCRKFMQLLTENCSINGLEDRLQSITFIIFNYDRCFEHYIYHALQSSYGIDSEESGRIVDHMNIYHPYGTVGALPWQKKKKGAVVAKYGAEPDANRLCELAGGIKTFTEGTAIESDIEKIRFAVESAKMMIFLGFGFHPLNIKLITPISRKHIIGNTQYFATAKGISEEDSQSIHIKLKALGDAQAKLIKLYRKTKCHELFDECWHRLSLN